MDFLMNMFFFKIEKEYGVSRDLLTSAWIEFNTSMTKEIVHLLPEEKQVSNLHVNRCRQPISKGTRMGQTCNRPVTGEDATVCRIHTKAAAKAKAKENVETRIEPRYCEHITNINTGKTCTRRVAGTATICTSHRKFYDDDMIHLPMCTAVTSTNKKCNRLAENGNETCKRHHDKSTNRRDVEQPKKQAVHDEYVDVDEHTSENSDVDMDDMDATIDADIERSLADDKRESDSESESESSPPIKVRAKSAPRPRATATAKPKKKRAQLAKAPKNLQPIEESDENDDNDDDDDDDE